MGWIVLCVIAFFVFKLIVSSSGNGNDQDDFSGNSTKSYFYLEEFIDKPSGEEDLYDQDETDYEVDEFDWFEEEE